MTECISNNITDDDLGTQEPQVKIVGMEFTAGPEGNEQIEEALGYTTHRFPTGEVYRTNGPYLMELARDYCADAALCIEMLDERGIVPFILPTEKPKGARKFEPGFVAVFEIRGEIHVTTPQASEEAAAACALWFALGISHD